MELTKVEWPSEITIGLQPDGTIPDGGVQVFVLSGYADAANPPNIIGLERRAAAPLTVHQAEAVLKGLGLVSQVALFQAQLAEARAARSQAEASVASLEQQLAAAQARIAELEQSIPIINNVPQQVTNYQARAALISAGLFNAVDDAVKAQGSASQAYQAWEYANVYLRTSPFIVEMGAALGLTAEQIDELFISASQIS